MGDFHEWRRWLDRKSQNEETSWQGWWVMETEYMNRTPRSTKFWLTLFNIVVPALIIAACISSLEANSISRVYFLLISVGGTVGLVVIGLFLIYQFHPVGDTYRWLKFVLGVIVLALLIVTIIFDTGSTSFGWKGTNFAVYLIVIALTFNCVCKVLMIHGAGPYRFGFCLTWFKYCDIMFGLIVYGPWLLFSFIGLASLQTRLLYNRAFFRGLRVSELMRQDPNKKDKFKARTAVITGKGGRGGREGSPMPPHQQGFTPMNMTRENSFEDLRVAGKPRTGLSSQAGEHSYSNRSKNYSHIGGGSTGNNTGENTPNDRSYNNSRRGSADDTGAERQGLMAGQRGEYIGGGVGQGPQNNLLIYSQSPSNVGPPPQFPPSSSAAGSRPPPPIPSRANIGHQLQVPSGQVSRQSSDEEKSQGAVAAGQPRYTYN